MTSGTVALGTIEFWGDLACPWASLAVHRLLTARRRLGLDDVVRLDHHAFPLELINRRPTPKRILDPEFAVIADRDPSLGWQVWQRPDFEWPGTVLTALEAVQAAKAEPVGGPPASEQLDAALRHAFYAESRPIGLLTEILDVAAACSAVDAERLEDTLSRGAGRDAVLADWHAAGTRGVRGSPHLFLPDGGDVHNPGITLRWIGKPGRGRPVIESDDPAVYDDLLARAARSPA
jgi:predicted DsbA family dithiol-disulfide isomerase